MDRTEKIQALLGSMYDYLDGASGGVKTTHLGDLPGPAPTKRGPCPACGGAGTFGKRKQRVCAACNGEKEVPIDAYTGEPVGTEKTRVRSADRRRIESELAKLAHDEAIRRGSLLDDPFAWEAARIRYRQAGSYSSLEVALQRLRMNEPDLASLVMRCLVYGVTPVDDATRPHLERALAWLSRRMPPEIRVPRWVTETPEQPAEREWKRGERNAATKERNGRIVQLAQDGTPRAEIAQELGVSAATISRVLKGVELAGTAA